jgi:hypothetical protein
LGIYREFYLEIDRRENEFRFKKEKKLNEEFSKCYFQRFLLDLIKNGLEI